MNKDEFSKVFRVGEVIPSGAGPRKNAADLKILSIEDDLVRYKSVRSASNSRMIHKPKKMLTVKEMRRRLASAASH